jgi:hypothetical protein
MVQSLSNNLPYATAVLFLAMLSEVMCQELDTVIEFISACVLRKNSDNFRHLFYFQVSFQNTTGSVSTK